MPAQRAGQREAHLLLLVRREEVDDAGHRLLASTVCSVDITKWPVSAAAMAAFTVSMSRISPTMITSGSWRMAPRMAVGEVVGVDAHLALADHAELVEVDDLDRVLDRDDVDLAVAR